MRLGVVTSRQGEVDAEIRFFDLRGEMTVFQPLTITQISLGGFRMETSFPLHLDALHDFRLTLKDVSVVVKGRVVHCRISGVDQERLTYRTGVEFIEPPERVLSAIGEFIAKLKAEHHRD